LNALRNAVYLAIGLLIGVVFHEYMHGRVAEWRGDPTARNAGRLTLNPAAHIDPFGTVLLPIGLLLMSQGRVAFGYAKPVPVNPYFLKKRGDMTLVALAGPLTNFAIALVVSLAGMLVHLFGVSAVSQVGAFEIGISEPYALLYMVVVINVFLGVFNLMPVPPLDGSRILERFLPASARDAYERIEPFGFMIVFMFLYLFGDLFFRLLHPLWAFLGGIMGIPSGLL